MYMSSLLGLELDNLNQYWIGLSQNDGGVYTWVDGVTEFTTTNWGEGQPGQFVRSLFLAIRGCMPKGISWCTLQTMVSRFVIH